MKGALVLLVSIKIGIGINKVDRPKAQQVAYFYSTNCKNGITSLDRLEMYLHYFQRADEEFKEGNWQTCIVVHKK
jgi:hypothetical protein